MVEETVSRLSVRSAGRALLASLALAGLTVAFAWAAPERNGWAALALAVALALDGLAQAAGAWLARRWGGAPRIAGLPSVVLAFGPAAGLGAVLFGWFTAEIGRQPYIVYGQLRTADAHSPLTVNAVTTSLVAFLIAYAFIFGFGSYYLAKLLRKGPEPLEEAMRGGDVAQKPKRPLSAVNESLTPA